MPDVKGLLVLGAAAALVLPAGAAAARSVVPLRAQRSIASETTRLAYVPARVSAPYRYHGWILASGRLRIWFGHRLEHHKLIAFDARFFQGVCRARADHSYQMAGVKVWFGVIDGRRSAWRCVHGRKLIAWTRLGPRTFADVGLARIAASGHRIRLS